MYIIFIYTSYYIYTHALTYTHLRAKTGNKGLKWVGAKYVSIYSW